MALKESWKTVLTDLLQFGKSLGKTAFETMDAGADALDYLLEKAQRKMQESKAEHSEKAVQRSASDH